MRKPEGAEKLVQKAFTLSQFHLNLLDKFIRKYGCVSYSDAIRKAIESFDKELDPPYKRPRGMGLQREREVEEQVVFDNMSDEEFAKETFQSKIVSDNKGDRFVLLHWVGNTIKPVPLNGIKKWVDANQDMVGFHQNRMKDTPIDRALSDFTRQNLEQQYGIIFAE